ncbi:MAG: DinB family protein [Thermoanaerobaculia bacterium]|nr:DinB family protein [Thermoanaerobaculia bacterium]
MRAFFTPTGRSRRHYRDLVAQFDPLLELMDDPQTLSKRDDAISRWSVGEQLEHIAKVDGKIFEAIEALLADPSEGTGTPVRLARVLLLLGRFPRGRGKSPKALVATGIDLGQVRSMLEQRRDSWRVFGPRLPEVVASRARAPHPSLGDFNALQWLRFAQIHIRHHRLIIDDIRS